MRVARPRAADPRRPATTSPFPPAGSTTRWASPGTRVPTGGRYELFYQFNPEAPVWAPALPVGPGRRRRTWSAGGTPGRRSSPDRTRPAAGRARSSSTDDGTPVIVYTSVLADAPGQGRIALARGDAGLATLDPGTRPGRCSRRARAGAGPRTLPRPLRLAGRATSGGWRSAPAAPPGARRCSSTPRPTCADGGRRRPRRPGAGRAGPGAARSGSAPSSSGSTGLGADGLRLGRRRPAGVACAVGDYDGRRFTPRAWHRLADRPLLRHHRPSRDSPSAGGARCPGCRSPGRRRRLGRRPDGAVAARRARATASASAPHPDVDVAAHRDPQPTRGRRHAPRTPRGRRAAGRAVDVELRARPGGRAAGRSRSTTGRQLLRRRATRPPARPASTCRTGRRSSHRCIPRRTAAGPAAARGRGRAGGLPGRCGRGAAAAPAAGPAPACPRRPGTAAPERLLVPRDGGGDRLTAAPGPSGD